MAKSSTSFAEQPEDWDPESQAPELLDTYESVTAFLTWVTKEQSARRIGRGDARELRDHAKAMISAIRARHSEHELEEYKKLVQRAEEANATGLANAVSDRYAHGRGGRNECAPRKENSKKSSDVSAGKKTVM